MKKALLLLLLMPALTLAKPWWLQGSNANENDFLQPDQAFRVSTRVDGELLRIRWDIADGYYLYRSKFDITAESPGLTLDKPVFPEGKSRTDEFFGTQDIYQNEVTTIVGFKRADAGAHPLQIKVTYQGCAEAGLCYPPIMKVLYPESAMTAGVAPLSVAAGMAVADAGRAADSRSFSTVNQRLTMLVAGGGVLAFFLAGLARSRKRTATAL